MRQLRILESGKKRKSALLDTLFSQPDLKQHLFPCVSIVRTLTQDPSIPDISMYNREYVQCPKERQCRTVSTAADRQEADSRLDFIHRAQSRIASMLADAVVVGRSLNVLKRTESAESSEDDSSLGCLSPPILESVLSFELEELAEPSPIDSLVPFKRGHRSQSMSTMDYSVSSDGSASSDTGEDEAALPALTIGVPAIETVLASGLDNSVVSPSLPGLTNSETVFAKRAFTKAGNTPPEKMTPLATLTRGVLNGDYTAVTFDNQVARLGLWQSGCKEEESVTNAVQATKPCAGKLGVFQLRKGDTCFINTESFALGYVVAKIQNSSGREQLDVVEADALDAVSPVSTVETKAPSSPHHCRGVSMTRTVMPGSYCGSICLFPSRGVQTHTASVLPLDGTVPPPQCRLAVTTRTLRGGGGGGSALPLVDDYSSLLSLVYTLSRDSCMRVLGSSLNALQRVFDHPDAVDSALKDLVQPPPPPHVDTPTGQMSAEDADFAATAAKLKGVGSPTFAFAQSGAPYTFEGSLNH